MDNCSALDKSVHNFSEMSYPGEPRYLRTLYLEDHVKIAFIVLLMVGTLLGNISVIVVVAFTKSMRTTINLYVVNLAVADLLVCAICMSSLLIDFLHGNHIYVLGPVMCKAMYFFQNTFLTSSVLTLSAIACDRFTAILFPFHSRITKQRTGLILTAVWMLSIAVSIPLLFIRKHYTLIFSDFVQPNCGDQWPRTLNVETGECETLMWVPQFYYAFVTITLFFLPVVIMTVTYSLILRRLSVSVPGEAVEGNQTAQDRSRKKVIKMVFTVLLVFVLCWMPNQLVILYDKFRKEPGVLPGWYLEVARVSEFLAFSNSFLNPIIYGGYNKNFRDNLCLLLCCKRRRRRFGTPGILQRFRLTLTTALSTSTTSRKPIEAHDRKRPKVVVNEDAAPTPNNEAVPQSCAEACDAVQEVKATPV